MKLRIVVTGIFFFLSCASPADASKPFKKNHIVVVIASYNNAAWYKANLESLFAQEYDNYHAIYVDDHSTDGTYEGVCAYVQECGMSDKIVIVRNPARTGRAIGNQYNAIHTYCQPNDIVIILDGDDRFVANHEVPAVEGGHGVLAFVNNMYQDESVWITYGQYREWHSRTLGFCRSCPADIVAHNAFRHDPYGPSHLRTFRAGLFMNIKKEDLLDVDGDFLRMTGDLGAMIPMMEMAQKNHFRFNPVVLLEYNDINPLNDHMVSKSLQYSTDRLIRSRARYQPLDTLF
jgi:glycosyltransferase involved in cell wall biosynthesis